MYKTLFSLAIIASLFVLSCKKKDKEPAPVTSGGGSGTTTGGTTGGGSLSPSNATTFNAILGISNLVIAGSYTGQSASAYFSSVPVAYQTSSTAIFVNKVYFKGDSLSKLGVSYYSWGPLNISSPSWSVSGANGIPSFSFTDTAPLPTYTVNFPDSISKSTVTTFTVKVANTSTLNAFLNVDDNNNGNHLVFLANGTNTVSLTPSDLAAFTPTSNGYISLMLNNSNAYEVSQKAVQFNRLNYYEKPLKIKP